MGNLLNFQKSISLVLNKITLRLRDLFYILKYSNIRDNEKLFLIPISKTVYIAKIKGYIYPFFNIEKKTFKNRTPFSSLIFIYIKFF